MASATVLALIGAWIPLLAAANDAGSVRLGRYATGDGLTRLVLDRRTTPILIRFETSEEIIALYPEPAPRGATLLVRDDGRRTIRLSPGGDITLAVEGRRDPMPVFRDGDAEPLEPDPCTPAAWAAARATASERLATLGVAEGVAAAGGPGDHEADWVWCAALGNAMIALDRVAATSFGGRAVRGGLTRLTIEAGPRAGAMVKGDVIRIIVGPSAGWFGVASSYRVEDALEEGL